MTVRAALMFTLAFTLPDAAAAAPPCAGELCLTVASWNLHGLPWPISKDPGGRMERAGARIREAAPQIAVLQEVWNSRYADRLSRALGADWAPFYAKRPTGGPKGGLVVFVRRSGGWTARGEPEFHPYASSAPWWRVWEGDGAGGKGLLVVRLEFNGRPLALIATHLQSQYPGVDYRAVREAQLAQLRSAVSRLDPDVPLILAGDFNTDSRESLYASLTALGTDLTSGFRRRFSRGTVFDSKDGRPLWIDYVLSANPGRWRAMPELSLMSNRGIDDPFSDHEGLLCAVTFNKIR